MPSSSLIRFPGDVILADHIKGDVKTMELSAIKVDTNRPESIKSDSSYEKGQRALQLCSIVIKVVGLLVIVGIVILFAHFVPKMVQQNNNNKNNDYNSNPVKANLPNMKGVND